MTEFANKSFSVYPGKDGGQQYRDNWDRIYGKGKKEEPEPPKEPELCKRHLLPRETGQCPYSQEINNEVTECDCCDKCRQDCADDI